MESISALAASSAFARACDRHPRRSENRTPDECFRPAQQQQQQQQQNTAQPPQ